MPEALLYVLRLRETLGMFFTNSVLRVFTYFTKPIVDAIFAESICCQGDLSISETVINNLF